MIKNTVKLPPLWEVKNEIEGEQRVLSWAFALGMWQNCQRAAQADSRAPPVDIH